LDDFEHAFPSLYGRAYGVAFVIVGSRAEAEDVAAEVAARAYPRWATIAAYADPWVVRVAGNLAIDLVRRRHRPLPAGREAAAVPGRVERIDLQRALLGLPRRQREVVVLRFIGDLPEAAVAEALGCTTGTVKSHASRGLAALRLSLAEPT
jgi:RNA polymerase sigma factor (sigma-70 family)